MNDSHLESQLARWLADGPRIAPAHLAGAASAYALAHPRGRGFNGWRSLVAGVGALARPTPVALRPLMLLMLLALTFALGAFFYAAWHNNALLPGPSPTVEPSPSPVKDACPPGSSPNQPGPADQPRPWAASIDGVSVGPSAFDSRRGQVFVVVTAVPDSGNPDDRELWTFDVCANTWSKSDLDLRPAGRSAFSFLVYDPTLDALLTDEGGQLGAFELSSGTKTRYAQPPFGLGTQAVVREASDQLIVRDPATSRLGSYDLASGTWAQLDQAGDVPPAGGSAELMAYDASVDRLVMYTANSGTPPGEKWTPRTYEYDFATKTWTRTGDAPRIDFPYGIAGGYEMTYDVALGRVVVFEKYAGFSYDATTQEWDNLRLSPYVSGDLASVWSSVVYDSINHRIVVVGPGSDGVFAVDAVHGTWQTLLAPSTSYPAPSPTPTPLACAGDPNDPGPVGQRRPEVGHLTSDPATGQIFATGAAPSLDTTVWKFDACANSWYETQLRLDSRPSFLFYEPKLNDLLLVGGHIPSDRPWVQDALSRIDLAGRVTDVPLISTGHTPVGAVHRSLTGETVVLDGAAGPWAWDETAKAWASLPETGDVPPNDAVVFGVAYDQSTDRLILYAAGAWTRIGSTTWPPRTYEYDFGSATWLRGEDPPDVRFGGYGHNAYMAYDEAHARTVLVSDNRVVGYDSTSHTWETLLEGGQRAGPPDIWLPVPIVYDAVNQRIVAAPGDTSIWAFDLDTRAWVSLLAPAEP